MVINKTISMIIMVLFLVSLMSICTMASEVVYYNNGQDFKVTDIWFTKAGYNTKVHANDLKENTQYDAHMIVRNYGNTGTKAFEATFLGANLAWLRYIDIIQPQPQSVIQGGKTLPNCVSNENWQTTSELYIFADSQREIVYRVLTPTTNGESQDYVFVMTSYFECGEGYNQKAYVTIKGDTTPDPYAHCFDRIINSGESDMDCGDIDGDCNRCREYSLCYSKDSCKSGLLCYYANDIDGRKRCMMPMEEKWVSDLYCSNDETTILRDRQTETGAIINLEQSKCSFGCEDGICTEEVCTKKDKTYCSDDVTLTSIKINNDCEEIAASLKCEYMCIGNVCIDDPTICTDDEMCPDGITIRKYCLGTSWSEEYSCDIVEKVCCEKIIADGTYYVIEDKAYCDVVVADNLCEQPPENICCKIDSHVYVWSGVCAETMIVADIMCESTPPECTEDVVCDNGIILKECNDDGYLIDTGLSCIEEDDKWKVWAFFGGIGVILILVIGLIIRMGIRRKK